MELEFSKLEFHAVKKLWRWIKKKTQVELEFSKLEFQLGKFLLYLNLSLANSSSRQVKFF